MKKKLKLQIEKLRVEQFEAHPSSLALRGTVHGLLSDLGCAPASYYCGVESGGVSEPCHYCVDVPGSRYIDFTDCC
jgi:hypothetical protein